MDDVLSLGACLHAAAQDRICTADGTVIECRISDFERFDGSVSYFLPGTEGLRLVTADGIKYIEIGGTKLVRDLTGKFVPMNVRQSVDAPRIEHYFGVTGGYLTGFWSAGATYSWFLGPAVASGWIFCIMAVMNWTGQKECSFYHAMNRGSTFSAWCLFSCCNPALVWVITVRPACWRESRLRSGRWD